VKTVELTWHPGPAIGGGGTADDIKPPGRSSWWYDGELLLLVVFCKKGAEVSCVRVHADGDMLDFANAATGNFDFEWLDRDIAWWARLDGLVPAKQSQSG
jgi:hypothetical protein